jgi:hypothetical protein
MAEEKKVEVARKVIYTLTCPTSFAAVKIAKRLLDMAAIPPQLTILEDGTLIISHDEAVDLEEDRQIFSAIMKAGYSS